MHWRGASADDRRWRIFRRRKPQPKGSSLHGVELRPLRLRTGVRLPVSPVGCPAKQEATRVSQPKRAMRALQASSAKIEVADQGFDSQNRTKGTFPQAQWSQLHTVEIASFRLTSASMKFPPPAVIGASSLRSGRAADLSVFTGFFFLFRQHEGMIDSGK